MPKTAPKRGAKPTAKRRPATEPVGARIAFGPVNYVLFAVAVVTIVVGYLLLGQGSITLAPILLVLGYVVLLPAGILIRGRPPFRRDVSGE